MEKLLRESEMRNLIKKVSENEISYSRMVEMINEKHYSKLIEVRSGISKDTFVWKNFKTKKPRQGRRIIWWGFIYGFEDIEWYSNCKKALKEYGITHWTYTDELPKPIGAKAFKN